MAWERECFADLGLEIRVDIEGTILSVYTEVEYEDEKVEVEVRYPSGFPHMPPKVFGPTGILERHQNPNGGNFCLTDNDDNWWRPEYPGSWLIAKLQDLLVATAAGEDALAEGEADMPEPFTGHHPFTGEATVLVGEAMLEDGIEPARGRFLLQQVDPGLYVLKMISDEGGHEIGTVSERITENLQVDAFPEEIQGSWFQWARAPKPDELVEIVKGAADVAAKDNAKTLKKRRGGKRPRHSAVSWVGVTFFEQGSQRDGLRRAWIFVKLRREPDDLSYETIGTQAIASKVRSERIPELALLADRSFLLMGAGSLGGTVALELAKAGAGRIDIIDSDHYDVNNSVRHVLPARAAGRSKAVEVAKAAKALNLESTAIGHHWDVGSTAHMAELNELVATADVVIDASGSRAAARLLHSLAATEGKVFVSLALTPGAFGGRVIVLRGANPCLDCFFHHRKDGSIPSSPEAETSNVTPYGCSHPAASAAGFDATELAALGARAAVQAADPGSYPRMTADWIVVSFRDFGGDQRYQEGDLSVHPECLWCQ